MTFNQKKAEIQRFQKNLKAEMPRVLKEIEVYEKALKTGSLKQNPKPSPQFNFG